MGRLRKYLASSSVFIINLILMGIGFLFIKNHDEAKKQQEQLNDDLSSQTIKEPFSNNDAVIENSVVDSLGNPAVDDTTQAIPVDTKVKTNPAPAPPISSNQVPSSTKPNSKTKTS